MAQVTGRLPSLQGMCSTTTPCSAHLARRGAQQIAPNGEYEFVQQVSVDKPRLWSVADPYLYKVHTTVSDQGKIVDEYDTPTGIREALFDADKGFLLNGEHVKLNDVCLHHEAGSVGAAVLVVQADAVQLD